MRLPNLFLVGAPRCGTTAMIEYLRLHPDIAFASYKEPHYFGSDLTDDRFQMYRNKPRQYQALFSHVKDERYVGEGSVGYLFSTEAAREIYEYNPHARIIIMLRQPVDALHSMYKQAQFTGAINFDDFNSMIHAHHAMRANNSATTQQLLLSSTGVQYGQQVARYFEVFDKESIHIILFEDFISNVSDVYRHALEFLSVDEKFQPDEYKVVNARQVHRNPILKKILSSKTLQKIGMSMPNMSLPIYRWLKQFNSVPIDKSQIPSVHVETYKSLIEEIRTDIKLLEHLIQRDLSKWLVIPDVE